MSRLLSRYNSSIIAGGAEAKRPVAHRMTGMHPPRLPQRRRFFSVPPTIEQGRTMPIWALYLVTVAIWGTSWYGIKEQLGVVAPTVSIAYRFLLAAAMLW